MLRSSKIAVTIAVALVVALPAEAMASKQPTASMRNSAVVAKIVDGDTIDVVVGEERRRVRFLNINTPEVGRCMSDAATAFTARQLPLGSTVRLAYDREREDRYGRTLAFVTNSAGVELSVALARGGLGVPMLVRPNKRFYGRVVRAARRAQVQHVGFFNPRVGCTVANDVRSAKRKVGSARSTPVRTQRQYQRALAKLALAERTLAKVKQTRYGLTGTWFTQYLNATRSSAQASVRRVRSLKKSQRAKVIRSQSKGHTVRPGGTGTGTGSGGGSASGGGGGYNGPRCYEPGGIVWHPC